jgi:hypothetical protein
VKEIVCEASSRMIDPIWPGYRVTRTAKQPPAAEDPPPQLLFHAPPSSRSPLLLCRAGGSGPEEAIPGGRIGRVLEARMRGRWRRGERTVRILPSQSSSSTKIAYWKLGCGVAASWGENGEDLAVAIVLVYQNRRMQGQRHRGWVSSCSS